jgi:hypothetical protein
MGYVQSMLVPVISGERLSANRNDTGKVSLAK